MKQGKAARRRRAFAELAGPGPRVQARPLQLAGSSAGTFCRSEIPDQAGRRRAAGACRSSGAATRLAG